MTPEQILGDRWCPNEPLAKHASLRIGGPAKFWAEIQTIGELEIVSDFGHTHELPLFVVGLGSNTLFPDEGIDGIVLRLSGELASWQVHESDEETLVTVGAGVLNAHLVRGLLRQGWVGMEFLSLIPGTFGGAVAMNAGTREKELSEILCEADIWSADRPRKVTTMSAQSLNMTYRHCALPQNSMVLQGTIRVARGDVDAAVERVRIDKTSRNITQPYRLASVGSTFANPEGDYAGRLIEDVGLKGHKIGGAQVSELHANFFINSGGSSSEDFLLLMATARCRVRQAHGIELRPEVKFVGFDGWSRMLELEATLEGSC